MKTTATLLRHIMYSCLALLAAAALASCEETEQTDTEHYDWCNRNNAYFAERMAEARAAVAHGARFAARQSLPTPPPQP